MNVIKAIEVINRRAATMQKLFGAHSEPFELFSTDMAQYDVYTNAKGFLQLNKNKANKSMYRNIIAWAKRIQKTPYSVIKRKAEKYKESLQELFEDEFDNEITFDNIDVYNKWLETFRDYFESCYELALREGFEGWEAYYEADRLYNDRNSYINTWNSFYRRGDFSAYEQSRYEREFWQEHTVDTETGEVLDNPDFYEDI